MSKIIAEKLVNISVSTGSINVDESDLYLYAYQVLVEGALCWVSIVLISLLFGILEDSLIFILFFIPLRIYAGGYHARSFTGCYLLTVGSFTVYCLVRLAIFTVSSLHCAIICLLCGVCIFNLSPLADPNKPLCYNEVNVYGRYAKRILFIELVIVGVLLFISCDKTFFYPICFSFILLAFLLLVAKIKLSLNKYNKNRTYKSI